MSDQISTPTTLKTYEDLSALTTGIEEIIDIESMRTRDGTDCVEKTQGGIYFFATLLDRISIETGIETKELLADPFIQYCARKIPFGGIKLAWEFISFFVDIELANNRDLAKADDTPGIKLLQSRIFDEIDVFRVTQLYVDVTRDLIKTAIQDKEDFIATHPEIYSLSVEDKRSFLEGLLSLQQIRLRQFIRYFNEMGYNFELIVSDSRDGVLWIHEDDILFYGNPRASFSKPNSMRRRDHCDIRGTFIDTIIDNCPFQFVQTKVRLAKILEDLAVSDKAILYRQGHAPSNDITPFAIYTGTTSLGDERIFPILALSGYLGYSDQKRFEYFYDHGLNIVTAYLGKPSIENGGPHHGKNIDVTFLGDDNITITKRNPPEIQDKIHDTDSIGDVLGRSYRVRYPSRTNIINLIFE